MDKPTLKFERAGWSETAAARLARIAGDDAADLVAFEAHVTSGAMRLLEVHLDGQSIGVLIWSLVDEPARRVVVVNAVQIDPVPRVDMMGVVFDFGMAMGERHGASLFRGWTKRAGMVRKLKERVSLTYVMEAQIGQQ